MLKSPQILIGLPNVGGAEDSAVKRQGPPPWEKRKVEVEAAVAGCSLEQPIRRVG